MRKLLNMAAIGLMALSLNSCLAGKFMAHYAITPSVHGEADIERTRHKADSLMPGSTQWYDNLKAQGVLKDHWITNDEGLKLHACSVPAADPANAQGTAIVVHGYGDNHYVFLYLVRMYRDQFNYNVLFPDLQYHGYSEGDEIQMGWKDRLDVMKWIEVAHGLFKDDFMVLHGVSMGAATVMMTSGEALLRILLGDRPVQEEPGRHVQAPSQRHHYQRRHCFRKRVRLEVQGCRLPPAAGQVRKAHAVYPRRRRRLCPV